MKYLKISINTEVFIIGKLNQGPVMVLSYFFCTFPLIDHLDARDDLYFIPFFLLSLFKSKP